MKKDKANPTPHMLTPETIVPLYRTLPLTQYDKYSADSGELIPVIPEDNAKLLRDFSIEHKT